MAVVDEQVSSGEVAAQISRGIVPIWLEHTGRGPTAARTTITDDLVVVVMADTLLKAERNLACAGKADEVLSLRRAFQDAMGDDLTELVERATGRKVVAFMSHNHLDPDLAAELFVLEPLTPTAHDGRPDAVALELEAARPEPAFEPGRPQRAPAPAVSPRG